MVDSASDGEEALAMFEALEPEIVLLDVMLPRLSGIDVCRRIRALADRPVIMVSARREEIDTVVGLEVGADDYVAKPYRVRELVARMRTVMRRSRTRPVNSSNGAANLSIGEVTVDRDRHEVTIGGRMERLPLKEFEVLALLMEKAGFVVSRQTLIDRLWRFDYVGNTKTSSICTDNGISVRVWRFDYVGNTKTSSICTDNGISVRVWRFDYVGNTKTLDMHIKRLRSRIERDPAEPERIVTIRGLGYKHAAP